MDIQQFLDHGDQYFMNNVSIDVVILGFQDGELKVLLSEFNNKYLLPGGHIGRTESVGDAAVRIIKERTGISNPFLKLFQIFGDKDRSFIEEFKNQIMSAGYTWRPQQWLNNRFITIAYFALVDIEKTSVKGNELLPVCTWHSINNLPEMLLDHGTIILELHQHLKQVADLYYIAHHLLPEKFTLPQLRGLHEVILDRKLDRSRFQQKVLSLNIYERLPLLNKNTPGRKPYLYKYK